MQHSPPPASRVAPHGWLYYSPDASDWPPRAQMIGIMGFVAESKVPGSVPALEGIIKPFAGDVMAPLV